MSPVPSVMQSLRMNAALAKGLSLLSCLLLVLPLRATICPDENDPHPRVPYGIGIWRENAGTSSAAIRAETDATAFARGVAGQYANGMYMIDLDVDVIDGVRYFNAVFSNVGAGLQIYLCDLDQTSLQSQNTILTSQGYSAMDVETYEVQGMRLFAAVWQQNSTLSNKLHVGMSASQLTSINNGYARQGLQPEGLVSWQGSTGQILYTGIWKQSSSQRILETGSVWSDFLSDLDYYHASNLRLVDIDSRVAGGVTFYTSIWEVSSETAYFVMGNCYDDVLLLREHQRGDYHLVDFERVVDDEFLAIGEGGGSCSQAFPAIPGGPDELTYCESDVVTTSGVVDIPSYPQKPFPD